MSDLIPVKVFLGIPSTGTRSDAQVYFLEEVKERYAGIVELVYPKQCVYRTFHDFARNAMVEEFLESDCDILWFLDSDVVPPKHVLDLIAIHGKKWEAAGAPYPIWMTPPGGTENTVIFTAYKGVVENETTKGIGITEVPRSGTEFIDALATGCLFLKRSLLERMEKPYFEFKFDPKTRQMIRITLPQEYEERAGVKDLVDRLMGNNPAHRFAFIQENAARVDEEAIDA